MKNLPQKISFILFFSFLVVVALVTVFKPKLDFSENENRVLEKFPEFSAEKIFNRKFMNGLESYISDHFVGRTEWIRTKTGAELLSGKRESNGVFILKDRLAEKLPEPDMKEVDKSIAAINNFSLDNKNAHIYAMIVPTSTGIYSDELPLNVPQYDQKMFIDEVYDKLSDNIIQLDAYTPLYTNRQQYIYYRNDHHWTTLGAYYAYDSAVKDMGFTPIPLGKYDIEHANNEFKGTLYSKALYDKIPADTIDIYYNTSGPEITSYEVNDGKETTECSSIYFREYIDKKDKYETFCGPNEPAATIKTNVGNNSKLLIIKDSYAHCYVPFLAQHYSEITMLDLRYINDSYKDIVNMDEYDDVLFLYNVSTFASDTNIKKLDF